MHNENLVFSNPAISDGRFIYDLVVQSNVLDVNSRYAYLLWCSEFGQHSIVCTKGKTLVGFVNAFRPPDRQDHLFVWQIAVDERMRGMGLGLRLLCELVDLPANRDIRFLDAHVGESNEASAKLFTSFANRKVAPMACEIGFSAADFGPECHEQEWLYRIGPFSPSSLKN
ncbi:MAG: diaminobutyrate acetyltransferase [Pirellulaceae bacterium]